MSILSTIFHRVFDDAYPLVKSVVNGVKGIEHVVVEEVKERVIEAAQRIETADIEVEIEIDLLPEDGRVTAAILDARAAQRELVEKTSYDWRCSPEDLLKLLDMPAGFGARQQLAALFGMPAYRGTERDGEELLAKLKAKFLM